jgi:hypothetical protein
MTQHFVQRRFAPSLQAFAVPFPQRQVSFGKRETARIRKKNGHIVTVSTSRKRFPKGEILRWGRMRH